MENVLFEPGIYFGLPEKDYHADSSLGSHDLKDIVLDPVEFQHARLHGSEPKETMALKWGSAIHCRALEGRASFEERFPIAPVMADYGDDLLVTMDQLRAYANLIGVKAGKTKDLTIKAIRDFDTDVPIWDEIIAKFEADNIGKTIIPREALRQIEQACAWMQRDRLLAPVMEDGTITAGASEVSIFYEDNGVRLKARIDHLLSHAVIDLKSFRPIMAERKNGAAKRAISRMRYDLQAAAYLRALRAAADLFSSGRVFNNPYDSSFLEAVFRALDVAKTSPESEDALKWVWVMIKAAGAPQPVVAEFDLCSNIFRHAGAEIEDAVNIYRANVETFGLDQDWAPASVVQRWGDGDFNPWSFE
ncbi:hypothetical protein DYI24_00310 [Rhodopseudomonas sp. BR0C11]|uniref:PD-(D/E)XK nuclease-like domain-containing protein n=1 Tax=Rhodopseudomonas sp. BR0C11 TaxID=2269370 RepID=UPI0013E0E967|nr:PD-(D/E)XK nuclease-like domain-containing protein [Rhodopseudomonas sp. BR0C11]NEV75524.1 hypothetical protein [Rhodopseudomonas sp. BR0C11]